MSSSSVSPRALPASWMVAEELPRKTSASRLGSPPWMLLLQLLRVWLARLAPSVCPSLTHHPTPPHVPGTGSELCMAVDAAKKLEAEGKKVRVVSMPCWELFEEQVRADRAPLLTLNPGYSLGLC